MHGITKELEKLVRASHRLAYGDGGGNPFSPDQTEHAYYSALERIAIRDGYKTLVVVDVISGTSAGGINGICLAKSLSRDAPQDGLRRLWLERGSVMRLLAGSKLLPPLAGRRMLGWVSAALDDMDQKAAGSLMPPGLRLDLFVTTTDINGYPRTIPIQGPKSITTVVNKHVFRFHQRDGESNLDNDALALAARATSCFPGAFPPTAVGELKEDARQPFLDRFFQEYAEAKWPADLTHFIDGGVLDNFPFRHAVDAIPGKPAATQVDRKLLFIEPDPADAAEEPTGAMPRWRSTVWAGISKLPRRQPIADALDELRGYNERVRRVKQMIEVTRDEVVAQVLPLVGLPYAQANAQAQADALQGSLFVQAYLRLKLLSVVEGMARAVQRLAGILPTSGRALFIQRALLEWAREQQLLDTQATGMTPAQLSFLRTFDLGYGRRRLTFVIGRTNVHYATADRALLNALKHRLYELLCELETVIDRRGAEDIRGRVLEVFDRERLARRLEAWDVDGFLHEARSDLGEIRELLEQYLTTQLDGFGERSYGEVDRLTADLPADTRRDLLAHYLGFPFWDAVTYPARALSNVGELDEVEVVRVSPLDSPRLEEDGRKKLKGTALLHFSAFFRRSWRENDYLWGRLDGAERLFWLLGEKDDDTLRSAYAAIAADERRQGLGRVAPLEYVDRFVEGRA